MAYSLLLRITGQRRGPGVPQVAIPCGIASPRPLVLEAPHAIPQPPLNDTMNGDSIRTRPTLTRRRHRVGPTESHLPRAARQGRGAVPRANLARPRGGADLAGAVRGRGAEGVVGPGVRADAGAVAAGRSRFSQERIS